MHNQHFLLEAQARKISLPEVAEWDDETVRAKFQELRWPETDGEPVSPSAGVLILTTTCEPGSSGGARGGHTFSLTSGTWLASTKLPLKKILMGIVALTNAVKGMSALQLMRHMNVQYKTAYVFYHRMGYFDHTQVNHDIEFVGSSGKNTNQAESYFSRLRRFIRGQVIISAWNIWTCMPMK